MEREDRRLEAAVALGIITADQAASIRGIAPLEHGDDPGASRRRPARPFNAATLAYFLGALTVVIAMGWFLGDRWRWLGPGGVLTVSAIYAVIFLVTNHVLRREGFAVAAGVAVVLAVGCAPLAAAALLELTGWLQEPIVNSCWAGDLPFWDCRGEEFVVELATLLAALIALRFVRFGPLVAPIAGIAVRFTFHAADAFGHPWYGNATDGWTWGIAASLLVAIAYTTDRRQDGDEDFGFWLHCAAAVCATAASLETLGEYREYRHLLIPGAFVAFAMALTLQRFIWLLLGLGWFVAYLIWLSSDVFRGTAVFPLVLAALGISFIIATVWVQRNAATLIRRFGTVSQDGRPRFPGGAGLLLAPALIGLLMLPGAAERDRQTRADQQWSSRRWQRKSALQRKAQADSVRRDSLQRAETGVKPPA